MSDTSIRETAELVSAMEEHLKNNLLKDEPDKLWANSFIRKQIKKRKDSKELFSLQDHIRAMVYSMLSSGNRWADVSKNADSVTGCIPDVDKAFYNYDVEKLKKCSPEQLRNNVKKIHCGTQSTLKQMDALLSVNIDRLISLGKKFGTVDTYYQKLIDIDDTLKTLVVVLSTPGSIAKLEQMNVALVCEYLRNIGYDIPKPDRHICRILGSEHLALSDKKEVPPFEAFDKVVELAELMGKPTAEVDYILWSYCADGYGEICKKKNAKCKECIAKSHCKKYNNKNRRKN